MTRSAHVGTSGWQYRDWRGAFYPADLTTARWLARYAETFATVEVNNTFYRLPDEGTFHRWRDTTPPDFVFSVKASRYLSHVRRLQDPADPVDLFLSRAQGLGPRLGPVLLQLPPTLRAEPDRLHGTLAAFGGRARVAVEFRHPSWFTDEVFDILDRSGAALVLADRPGARVDPVVTGGWSYIRFHQGTRTGPGYRPSKLRAWADRIRSMSAGDVFVYFNNDTEAAAPRDAMSLRSLILQRGVPVAVPDGD
jgi:uncharacterized protein YecE (DUF72 family)